MQCALSCTCAGDAETKPLSALSDALGSEQCSCYGITEVAQSDAVFQNISVAGGDMSVAYADPAGTCRSLIACFLFSTATAF